METKELIGVIVAIIAIAAVSSAGTYLATREDTGDTGTQETALTVKGYGEVKKYSMDEVKNLESAEGWGSLKDSVGNISDPTKYKGVPLTTLLDKVGGLSSNEAVEITAKDGYSMTFSRPQVENADFITYDPITGDEVSVSGLEMIIAYEKGGEPLGTNNGPLRVVVIGPENQATDGHWWIKWVENINIVSVGGGSWSFSLEGAVDEEMDRGTFESGAAPTCHGVTWTNEEDDEYKGIPLWLLVGRVDDNNTHMSGAFNDSLANDNAYDVEVIAKDGYSATFTAAEINKNDNIIIAHQLNGESLPDDKAPVRVVGPNLSGKRQVSRISKIKLSFKEGYGSGWSISLEGETTEEMTQGTFELAKTQHSTSYTDVEDGEWSGVPLWFLVARVDDSDPMDFNENLASENAYKVEVMAKDGYSATFSASEINRNDNIIVANELNGEALPDSDAPLRIVGPNLSGMRKVSRIAKISVISTTSDNSWTLTLEGEKTEDIDKQEYESISQEDGRTWTCKEGNNWNGVPLWQLVKRVDDSDPDSFDDGYSEEGYTVEIVASDGYSIPFESGRVARNDNMLLAYQMNGEPIPEDSAPLELVGPNLYDSEGVKKVVKIKISP